MAQRVQRRSQTLIRIERQRRRSAIRKTSLLALAVFAAVAVYFFWTRQSPQAPQPPAPEIEIARAATPPVIPTFALPQLQKSDPFVRGLVTSLQPGPTLVEWLVTDDLVRRATVAVIAVSEGRTPPSLPPTLQIARPFPVAKRDGRLFVDPNAYRRFDAPVAVVTKTNSATLAKLYRRLGPLFSEAYAKEGYPDQDFDLALAAAMEELFATPRVEGEIELIPDAPNYAYKDPNLEDLSPAQKQMLRLGPENQRKVRRKLAALARELELPVRLE